MASHFIADLHLQAECSGLVATFHRYLAGPARQAQALYILGDLFEYWIGDDGSLPEHRDTVSALRALADSGVALYFMRGNRDFAVGEAFERACGIRILEDPLLIDLHGVPTLLTHGDLLCTDDAEHQAFRAKYTDPAWRRRMLRLPRFVRRRLARDARARSRANTRRLPADIMDVNADTVRATMHAYGAARLIHGHTHRPAEHRVELDGRSGERIVLADWHDGRGEALVCDADGCRRLPLD